jgi:hypothetical protein
VRPLESWGSNENLCRVLFRPSSFESMTPQVPWRKVKANIFALLNSKAWRFRTVDCLFVFILVHISVVFIALWRRVSIIVAANRACASDRTHDGYIVAAARMLGRGIHFS